MDNMIIPLSCHFWSLKTSPTPLSFPWPSQEDCSNDQVTRSFVQGHCDWFYILTCFLVAIICVQIGSRFPFVLCSNCCGWLWRDWLVTTLKCISANAHEFFLKKYFKATPSSMPIYEIGHLPSWLFMKLIWKELLLCCDAYSDTCFGMMVHLLMVLYKFVSARERNVERPFERTQALLNLYVWKI